MVNDTEKTAMALFATTLCMSIFSKLGQKGLFTDQDAVDVLDMGLLNLEQHSAQAGGDAAVFAVARRMYEVTLKGV